MIVINTSHRFELRWFLTNACNSMLIRWSESDGYFGNTHRLKTRLMLSTGNECNFGGRNSNQISYSSGMMWIHDDVIIWKELPHYWPFVRGITGHRWIPLTKASGAELWCFLWSAPWINGCVNNRDVGNLRRHRAHYDVIVMMYDLWNNRHGDVKTRKHLPHCWPFLPTVCPHKGPVMRTFVLPLL